MFNPLLYYLYISLSHVSASCVASKCHIFLFSPFFKLVTGTHNSIKGDTVCLQSRIYLYSTTNILMKCLLNVPK